jgi:ElaB/YqjD/DUF883 family membrane-anchored ribosome-binding protein
MIMMTKATSTKPKSTASKIVKKAGSKVKRMSKAKTKAKSLMTNMKGKLKNSKKSAGKALRKMKVKAEHTEEEILHYVKSNPIKSISAVALTALIAGFLSRTKK